MADVFLRPPPAPTFMCQPSDGQRLRMAFCGLVQLPVDVAPLDGCDWCGYETHGELYRIDRAEGLCQYHAHARVALTPQRRGRRPGKNAALSLPQ